MNEFNRGPETVGGSDGEEPAFVLQSGNVLANKYRLIEKIGQGGMGVVWSAEDTIAERKVVLKFVPSELKNFESAVAQLKKSFQKIHELQHPHICPVYTLEEEFSLGYYHTMKWLDGETLDKYVIRTVGRENPLPLGETLRILQPVASALDYAHGRHGKRIVHRDIKPSNIFIELDGEKLLRDVQVIDFGLASEIRSSLTRVSQIRFDTSGTRPYMAPEQWRGHPQSGQTDQYALAVVAYELLAGYLPFNCDDLETLRLAVLQDTPEPIRNLSDVVNAALLRALAKDKEDRFASCVEFVKALGGEVIPAASKPVPHPVSAKPRTSAAAAPGVESLMKRGHLFLEDSDWKQANVYFDRVLDIDPEYAQAYIGKLCAELKVGSEESLGDFARPISEQNHFQKALRFADEEYKVKIEGYDEKIKERLRQEEYDRLCDEGKNAKTEKDWQQLAEKFQAMNGYKDTEELANECERKCRELIEWREEQERLRIEQERIEWERIEKQRQQEQKRKREEQYQRLCERAKIASTEEDYRKLAEEFQTMNGYRNTAELADQCDHRRCVLKERLEKFRKRIAKFQKCISVGNYHTVGLKSDGTVVAIGDNWHGKCNTQGWRDIVAVSAGGSHTVGLTSDGMVVAVGNKEYGQCNTQGWRGIVAVSTGGRHTVGLKSDGTVVAVGNKCNTQDWRDIVAVSVGSWHTIGLKSNGMVIAVGKNENSQCNTNNWRDIVAISAGDGHTIGLKSNGTVVAVGNKEYGQCNTQSWQDIGPVSEESRLKRKQEDQWIQEEMRKQEELRLKQREELERKLRQALEWERQGLCRHCGGNFSFFGRTCKSCGRKN